MESCLIGTRITSSYIYNTRLINNKSDIVAKNYVHILHKQTTEVTSKFKQLNTLF